MRIALLLLAALIALPANPAFAQRVLREEFPELAGRVALHMPDEKEKRHGQAMAAASLPALVRTS